MTELLEQAIDAIQKLPTAEQDAIAARLLEELADDERWDRAFARSTDRLTEIADQVRTQIRDGKVRPMRMEDL